MKVENSKAKTLRRIGILVIITIILVPSFFSLTKNIIESAKSKASINLAFDKIEIKFENIFIKELEAEISQFVQAQIQQTNLLDFDQNKFYKLLKTNFNIIKQFDCHIDSLTLHLKIVGITPFCTVNNNWILGNKKKLFPTDLFDQATLTNLKNISIANIPPKNILPKDIYLSIKRIPQEYWQNFDINFIKFTEIYLTPKNQDLNYCLLTKLKTTKLKTTRLKTTKLNSVTLDEQKVTKAQELYNKLMHDEKFIKKMKSRKNHKLVLDLRFKNRIVVSFDSTKLDNNDKEGGR